MFEIWHIRLLMIKILHDLLLTWYTKSIGILVVQSIYVYIRWCRIPTINSIGNYWDPHGRHWLTAISGSHHLPWLWSRAAPNWSGLCWQQSYAQTFGSIQKMDPPWDSQIYTPGVGVQNWGFCFLDPPRALLAAIVYRVHYGVLKGGDSRERGTWGTLGNLGEPWRIRMVMG